MTYTEADLKPIPQSDLTGIPLLRERWDMAKADPTAWGQDNWIWSRNALDPAVRDYLTANQVPPWNCGTKYCAAGHIVLAKGATLAPETLERLTVALSAEGIITPDGRRESVSDYAQELLGIAETQADVLFGGDNTEEEMEAYVQALEADPAADLNAVRNHLWRECAGVNVNNIVNCPLCVADQVAQAQTP